MDSDCLNISSCSIGMLRLAEGHLGDTDSRERVEVSPLSGIVNDSDECMYLILAVVLAWTP